MWSNFMGARLAKSPFMYDIDSDHIIAEALQMTYRSVAL